MARITFGLGTSHSPMISLPASFWSIYAQSAKFNPELCLPPTCRSVTYEELLAQADS